jgi:pimeloyl-ACP methyl ester carboxylesterase
MIKRVIFSAFLFLFYCGTALSKNFMPYPVIFVHGLASKGDVWVDTRSALEGYYRGKFGFSDAASVGGIFSNNALATDYFPLLDFEERNNGDIRDIAINDGSKNKSLLAVIDKALSDYQSKSGCQTEEAKVILVCHSMGGLVARSLMHQFPQYSNRIARIVYVGTPHQGSPLASALWAMKEENLSLNQRVDEISAEVGTLPTTPDGWAKKNLAGNMRQLALANGAKLFALKSAAGLDSDGMAVEELRAADAAVESRVSLTGAYNDPIQGLITVQENVTESYGSTFLDTSAGNLGSLESKSQRIMVGAGASPDQGWFSPDLVSWATSGGLRSFTGFPAGNSLSDLDAMQGDGIVTIQSQNGVPHKGGATLPGTFHTDEPKASQQILQFLDEEAPVVTSSATTAGHWLVDFKDNQPSLGLQRVDIQKKTDTGWVNLFSNGLLSGGDESGEWQRAVDVGTGTLNGPFSFHIDSTTIAGLQEGGEYKFSVTDAVNHASSTTVTLDNFLPFRLAMSIGKDTSGNPYYEDRWSWNDAKGQYEYHLIHQNDVPGGKVPVRMEFSEPVKNAPVMNVDGGIGSVTLVAEDSERRVWVGTMTIQAQAQRGTHTVSVSAQDGGDHDLLAFTAASATFIPSRRGANGIFKPILAQGVDRRVQFTVDTTPPLLSCSGGGVQWRTGRVTCTATDDTAPVTVNGAGTGTTSATFTQTVGPGKQVVTVTAVDGAGNKTTQDVKLVVNDIWLDPPESTLTPDQPWKDIQVMARNYSDQPMPLVLDTASDTNVQEVLEYLWSNNAWPGWHLNGFGEIVLFGCNPQRGGVPPGGEAVEMYTMTVAYNFGEGHTSNGAHFPFKVWSGNLPLQGEVHVDGQNYHPDEVVSISSPKYTTAWTMDPQAGMGVLFAGYGEGLGHLLSAAGRPTSLVFSSGLNVANSGRKLEDLKAMAVGSGGGTELGVSAERIGTWVKNGGTIVALTQATGAGMGFLPRSDEFDYVGWEDDRSCQVPGCKFADGVA